MALTAYGLVNSASIDGIAVQVPYGSALITPNELGQYTVEAYVYGPGGTGICATTIEVQ